MPRYYFNVCCEGFETTDLVGTTCPNDVAALGEALRAASAVARKRLRSNDLPGGGWIEVEDEDHREILRLPLRAAAY